MPDEVVIADDGSNEDVQKEAKQMLAELSVDSLFLCQEDKGFRKARIINEAFAVAKGEYIINIDGDIIMERHFIEDHIKCARPGYFVGGGRAKIGPKLTKSLYTKRGGKTPHFWSTDLTSRLNALRIPLLTPLFFGRKHFRGCNCAFWKKDLLRVNGYDERFVGYGREDSDLEMRLIKSGVARRFLKFRAIEFHLFHKEADSEEFARTTQLFNQLKEEIEFRTPFGIDSHIKRQDVDKGD